MNEETTLQDRILAAWINLLARNRGADERPQEYYSLSVGGVRERGAEFDLCITFRASRNYCCCEPLCHVGVFREERWRQLRAALAVYGVEPVKPMIVRICAQLEAGARLHYGSSRLPEPEPCGQGPWTLTVWEEFPSVAIPPE